jgi:cell division protein FtsN
MKPKPYNRKKRFFIEMSRSQLFLSIAGALFVLCWIFILGIFVGRGYVSDTITRSFSDKIQKLQEEKKALMDKYLVQEKNPDIPKEEVLDPKLDFYDNLSRKETATTLQTTPKPTPKPSPVEGKTGLSRKPESLETKKETKETETEVKAPKMSQENASQNGSIMIQIGSYREEATAQSSVKRLSDKGYQARLRMKDIPQKGGKWFRVQIGPIKTRPEAEKVVKKLEHDGFQAVILEKNF